MPHVRTSLPSHPLRATALVLFAMALMGLVDNFVVVIAESAGLWQFQLIRSALALAALTLFARWRRWRLAPRRWRSVAARSAVMSTALILYFMSLALMPISEAVAGLFTAPIFTALLSAGLYRHPLGPVRLGAALCGFAGVLLVLRPDSGEVSALALLPVAAGLLYAFSALATREWCDGESAFTLLFGFFAAMGIWGLVGLAALTVFPQPVPEGAAGFSWRVWGAMTGEAWLWTVAQAAFALVAIGCTTRAYQIGEASYVAVFEYALLVFAVSWGWVLFGDTVDAWAMLGIAAIIASGAALALGRKSRAIGPVPADVGMRLRRHPREGR